MAAYLAGCAILSAMSFSLAVAAFAGDRIGAMIADALRGRF